MHVFKNFTGAKSGRADIMACPLGAKSERATARPAIGSAANARQTVPKAQKKLAEKQ